jgi:cell division protein ZapA
MSTAQAVSVTVLQKEYKLACPPEERDALVRSAALVDQKMREIRGQRKSVGLDRVAIITAINIAYELLQAQSSQQDGTGNIVKELSRLRAEVEDALYEGRQLELG